MIRYFAMSFIMLLIAACSEKDTLFKKLSSSRTGIHFNNEVNENDSINPIDLEFLYNGGGVAAADFNNDGTTDLYFTASTVSNRLYLNSGDLTFRDVTEKAGVTGEGRWANGVCVVDINNDGWQDIYLSNTIKSDPLQRRNTLYRNTGKLDNGVPAFKEMAAEYGLADTSLSVQSAFFDYDNDGDLDMYLMTTKLAKRDGARFFNNNAGDTTTGDVDKLFRNDWSDALQHPYFTDVSREAGIVHAGFGLGLSIADINKDGWKDIYVTNDFYGSDHLYINQKNGTFIDRINHSIGHTSQNAMGNDVADINNDGLADIIAVDMNPEDNFRKKKNMSGANYNIYQNQMLAGYNIQYVRNTLQLNLGPAILENDSVGDPQFGDISFLAGVAETDWSWNPSLADFDNDGWRDLVITNGYPRDVTDHDFTAYRAQSGDNLTTQELVDQIPQIRISNYAFRNTGDLHFENRTTEWGMDQLSFSNGAVYADLDNDGDLDYVINNINEEAMVYENITISKDKNANHFIKIKYRGSDKNVNGLGVTAHIFYDSGKHQVHENFPVRGYLSCVEPKSYFGLGSVDVLDSIRVVWPDGKSELLTHVTADREITVEYAKSRFTHSATGVAVKRDFKEITSRAGISYVHREMDYIDFDDQRLLPHKLSQYGPGLAAGDIDGNGLDDIFVGGSGNNQGTFLMQQKDGTFATRPLPRRTGRDVRYPENMGVLLFDADNDNDLDVYFANGSTEHVENSRSYADELLINDGRGNMQWDTMAIPRNYASKSAVRAADIDNDGDLDLFIAGRVRPGHYPQPASSFIYRNESANGNVRFVDATKDVAPGLKNIGMVCDALWTDYDNDGEQDLLLAGEWLAPTLFKNDGGKFTNVTTAAGLSPYAGWWNSLAAGDFDNDGDIDYVAGNLGTNAYLRSSDTFPLKIYQHDFDNNNKTEIIPTVFIKDENGSRKEFTVNNRDEIIEQLPGLKKKFLTYREFGRADVNTIFGKQLDDAFSLQANYLKTSLLQNEGNGTFSVKELPTQFQMAPIYAMAVMDLNADGLLDLVATGNDFGNEVANGRYDALRGIVAYGDGRGGFACKRVDSAGFYIPGDGKALVTMRSASGKLLVAASQNRGPLKLFECNTALHLNSPQPRDRYAIVHLKNGATRREEFYYGSSFLSQSARYVLSNASVTSIDVFDENGRSRPIEIISLP